MKTNNKNCCHVPINPSMIASWCTVNITALPNRAWCRSKTVCATVKFSHKLKINTGVAYRPTKTETPPSRDPMMRAARFM